MNYEEMSDLEINKRVAMHLGHSVSNEHECSVNGDCFILTNELEVRVKFNPCNNWADAGPIIYENEITIAKHVSSDDWEAYGGGYQVDYCHQIESYKQAEFVSENPIRAAMICFLKMKDFENE